ncbi:MAG: hypothetical protein ACUVX1_13050 [Chloroflexota bacterium]
MIRRLLLILVVLALVLSMGPVALADDDEPEAEGTPGPLMGKAFQGTIEGIDGTVWTVKTALHGSVQVDVSGGGLAEKPADQGSDKAKEKANARAGKLKVQWPGKKNAAVADFKVGDRVAVKLAERPTGPQPWKVRAVHLISGQTFIHFTGTLNGDFASDQITVQDGQGQSKTFKIDEHTTIRAGKVAKTTADLKAGAKVTVVARVADMIATAVVIHP